MTHVLRKLAGHRGSYALLSTAPSVARAVVFIHGFWGDAFTTWRQFQALIDSSPEHVDETLDCDCYFYEFKTNKYSLGGHADHCTKFIKNVFPLAEASLFRQKETPTLWRLLLSPLRLGIDGLARDPKADLERQFPLRYTGLTLVGHSMGGVIARAVLTKALHTQLIGPSSNPYADSRLRLFAPAHAGFRQGAAIATATAANPLSALVYAFCLYQNRAYNDLQVGSPVLGQVETDTMALAGRFDSVGARVLWGLDENVVFDSSFTCDFELERVPGQDHTSICKPRSGYLLPLDHVFK